ncbi:MAG: MBL fold metallo-hydrolase [Aeropyrum sp.]|nr:MBL fold metallo-hydrolase [Aeropyrum sp.]MCE4615440.1 MBL fold metallo-hydrolase [Aeropyrum sp.]
MVSSGECVVEIRRFPAGPLVTNTYLVWSRESRSGFAVDPGWPDVGSMLAKYAREMNLSIKSVILTHGHFDHVLGVESLINELEDSAEKPEVLISREDLGLAARASDLAYRWLGVKVKRGFDPGIVTGFLEDMEVYSFGGIECKALHTPGHTEGSYSLACGGMVFTGDTLFKGSIGRTDLPGGSWSRMMASLRRLSSLPPDTNVYPGHGPETTIGEEARHNQYVRMAWLGGAVTF